MFRNESEVARHSQATLDVFAGMIAEPQAPGSDLGDVIAADTDIPRAEPARDVFFAGAKHRAAGRGQHAAGELPRPTPGARAGLAGSGPRSVPERNLARRDPGRRRSAAHPRHHGSHELTVR
jgi:hypothetical protein